MSVADDTCSPVQYASGNTGNPNLFSVGETWTFTCDMTATLAQVVDVGTQAGPQERPLAMLDGT